MSGFRVQDSGSLVQCSWCRNDCVGCKIEGFGLTPTKLLRAFEGDVDHAPSPPGGEGCRPCGSKLGVRAWRFAHKSRFSDQDSWGVAVRCFRLMVGGWGLGEGRCLYGCPPHADKLSVPN